MSRTYVVRHGPQPALAALGRFSESEITQLEAHSARLRKTIKHLRYVDYTQAECDSATLAARLTDRIGRETLQRAHFIGIPRGGLIVLGMLSYTLDLNQSQIEDPPSPSVPLVVVDDCALTGSRFHRFLQRHPDRKIVFAPLYAHPRLRAAIEEQEPNVLACISARDLHDHAPDEVDDYEAWRARWKERDIGHRYWIGQPDHLCFPWSEPDTGVWNSATQGVEPGLRVVSPERCLKNKYGQAEASTVPVQVQPEPAGPIRPAPPVFFGTLGEAVIVAQPEADVCMELDGTAAGMWTALVEHGTISGAVEALLAEYDVDRATLEADLTGFVQSLAARDLLHVPREMHA